ncbi:long-chain fatty acid--CoA ligase [Nocardia higoensis]|uniref:Long-chain fatty acid--CoA ligase n=1 Tax=Nocardia higoensis TaxID=228599 RepID=A0ABS0DJC8_9NOCA|nr:AMP-dependent synthetase/ligase [Nocardia higoensis]MBF6358023.1 long-chain fatty acid--CoA ligase [Nocardia higoensis]
MNTVSVAENGFDIADAEGLYSVVSGAAQRHPTRLSLCGADGTQLDCLQVDRRVRALASALLDRGVHAGDRVAVLGRTSLEWALLDCAVLALGAVVVPVYPTSSPAQIAHILADSGSAHFAAETGEDADRLRAAGARQAWTFPQVAEWSLDAESPELDRVIAAVRADDPAMIVYTSGTTGVSKGCVITHRNMFVSSANTVHRTGDLFDGTTVLALPLAHVFGQTILFACLFGGSRTHLLPAIPDLVPALPALRPTFLAMIPYGLEKIRKYCRTKLSDAGEEDAAVARGLELLRAGQVPEPVSHPVSDALGGRLRGVISGGASLDESTIGFYAGFGVLLLNCYGLTEAATAVTVNAVQTHRLGTVGRPIPGTEVAVAEDGEVLVRGPHVSPGYWGAAADVPMADAEGWLRTGDLGELDADGYLRITGRKKEILVTSGGKNVAPAPLEDRIRLHPLVSNCMVVGDGRDFVTALVTLDADQVRRRRAADPDLDLDAEIAVAIETANALVSRAESVRAFRIVDGDFTVEDGLITSSRKLRRAAIEKVYADDISALYASRTVAR